MWLQALIGEGTYGKGPAGSGLSGASRHANFSSNKESLPSRPDQTRQVVQRRRVSLRSLTAPPSAARGRQTCRELIEQARDLRRPS